MVRALLKRPDAMHAKLSPGIPLDDNGQHLHLCDGNITSAVVAHGGRYMSYVGVLEQPDPRTQFLVHHTTTTVGYDTIARIVSPPKTT